MTYDTFDAERMQLRGFNREIMFRKGISNLISFKMTKKLMGQAMGFIINCQQEGVIGINQI